MKKSLANIPVYETQICSLPAEQFNLARIALNRLGSPIQIELPKLRTLELRLDLETWIIVDTHLNDLPVLAWLEFQTRDRALHEAVQCRLNLYHVHANLIHDRALEAMALILGERLADSSGKGEASVIPIFDIKR